MPPPQTRTPSRTLPIPREALTALDICRRCPTASLQKHLTTLRPYLNSDDSQQYILTRLHNGLTTSTARRNYTILLCAIARSTKASLTLLTAPYPQYTHPRHAATARLCLVAALIRAGRKDRAMISILRDIACCENGKWRLGNACVKLVESLLGIAEKKPLLEWCRRRHSFGDGLYLACILLRHAVISDTEFGRLFTPDDVRVALGEVFFTGFSNIRDGYITLPPVWLEALTSDHEPLHVTALGVLQTSSASIEKKIVTLALLPTAARKVTPSTFSSVFTEFVGRVARTLCDMRERGGGRLRKDRVTESTKRALKHVLDSLGSDVWQQFTKVTREIEEADQLCTSFIVWCVRHGIAQRLFPGLGILSEMEERLSKQLFEHTIREFAKAWGGGVRNSLVRFLFVLAVKCGFVEDAIKVVALYSAFEGGDVEFKLEQFLSKDGDTFAGCLPVPKHPLSQADAGVAFRRLVEFSAERRVASNCLDVLRKGLESGMVPRCASRIKADNTLKDAVFRVVESISEPAEPADKPLVDSLRFVAEFVAIQYFAPVEDPEAGQKSVAEFRGLVESLEACVSAVLGAEKEGEDEPMPVERIAHLITDLCGHESVSFRQISVKAIEALGSRLDDAVIAVLFDALDSYVTGTGVAGKEDDMMDEDEDDAEEEEDMEIDGEGKKEKAGEDEEHEDGTRNEDVEMAEVISAANDKEEEDESDGDSEPEVDDTVNGKEESQKAESEDDDDSGPDVDMDPDDEDPEVLAQFDRRLAMHMKLINKEKKTTKQQKLRAQFRFTQVSRVLSLMESVAKVLRMYIETAEEVDQRSHIVFLDLHARLYEFALGDEAENGRFLRQVTGIAAKQMMLPASLFAGKITDTETVVEIAKNFLQSIRDCTMERKPSDEETRIISKSAGCIVGTAAVLTGDDYGQFLPIYEDMVRQTLQSTKHLVNPGMLTSFFRRAPAEASTLFTVVEELLGADSMTKNQRTTASEIIVELAEAARQDSESDDENLDQFWDRLQKFLKKSVNAENVKRWRPLAISNFVQAASHGIRAGCFKDGEGLSAVLSEVVKSAHMDRKERLKLLKVLRKPGDTNSAKRVPPVEHDGVEEDEEENQDEVKKSKTPRKRSKRVKS